MRKRERHEVARITLKIHKLCLIPRVGQDYHLANSAARSPLRRIQYGQLLFLLWLAIASKLASVQVVA